MELLFEYEDGRNVKHHCNCFTRPDGCFIVDIYNLKDDDFTKVYILDELTNKTECEVLVTMYDTEAPCLVLEIRAVN